MKSRISIAFLLILLILLGGCSGNSTSDSMANLISGYSRSFERSPLDESVMKSMENLVAHYSGGVAELTKKIIPDPEPVSSSSPSDSSSRTEDTVCATLEDAIALEKEYLKKVTETFSITIAQPTDYSEELCNYFLIDFQSECPIECMFQKNIRISKRILPNQVTYKFNIGYHKPVETVRNYIQVSKQKLESINKDLNLSGMNTYDAVYKINEYFCDLLVYPSSEPYAYETHTVYGTVTDNVAVCEGYAKTAKAIMDMNNIESYYITGDTAGGGHGWNLVKVDGSWYHLDITWNDTGANRSDYFLVSDGFMSYSRIWDTTHFPATPAKNYNS